MKIETKKRIFLQFLFINKLKIVFTAILIAWSMSSWAQISEGGTPPSFTSGLRNASLQTFQTAIPFDVNKLLEEDNETDKLGLPPRCAQIIPVNLDIENSGAWSMLADGQRVWNLEIYAPDALAILLYYDQFIIPEGGKLFIYNPDHSSILGAYTSKTNAKRVEFATQFVYGDRIILEYVAPSSPVNIVLPQIKISGIAYGYNHLMIPAGNGLYRIRWDSAPCMVNINCSEGADWQVQKRGVARILSPVGTSSVSMCSGTLINNTSGDFDPLFLSAHHCYEDQTAAQMNQAIYYFNYEYPECENLNMDPQCPTMTGAQLLVDLDIQGESDGALMRLNDSVPKNYNVYFNGWDRRNIPLTEGVCIHHPHGDVKKISTIATPAISSTWEAQGNRGATNAHWNVFFAKTQHGQSSVEGGSSGSPLFNQNKLVVGSLTGGNAACDYQIGSSHYGKLWYHWDQGIQKMSKYLDPDNTGKEYIEGSEVNYELVKANFKVKEKEIYATRPTEFTNTSRNAHTWEWSFEGGKPAASQSQNPPLIAYNIPGIYTVTLIVDKGTNTEDSISKKIEVILKENMCEKETTVGNDTLGSISPYPLGASQMQTLSISIYDAAEIDMENGGRITALAWNALADNPTPRLLLVYMKETDEDSFSTTSTWEDEMEDATAVFASSSKWTNPQAWTSIELTQPFQYSGKKNLKVLVRAITSSNGGTSSNCRYTTAANKHLRWGLMNTALPTTAGTRNSNRPNIKFHFADPCGVELPVADFAIRENTETYRAGDTIALSNLSSGPAVNWEWEFPGGIPESSKEENPSTVYEQEGNYLITLKVFNHLGSDTLKKEILIAPHIPIAAFSSASSGFTTYPDCGQSLPEKGGKVTFTNRSLFNPVDKTWNFGILEPKTTGENTIEVVYPEGINTYSVNLVVRNEAGSDEKTVNDYIQVGGTAKIWNIPYNDAGNTYYTLSNNNYLTGTNEDYTVLAEKFATEGEGAIEEVNLLVKVMDESELNVRSYTVSIRDEQNNVPNKVLAEKSFFTTEIKYPEYTSIIFPEPVKVKGNFYIEIKGFNPEWRSRIAIASSKESNPTVYIYKGETWTSLENFDPEQRKVSMNIIPVYTHQNLTKLAETAKDNQVELYPNPVSDFLNIRSLYPIEKVIIQDIQGHIFQTITGLDKQGEIRTSDWQKGIYIVKIQTQKDTYNYKIIK